jgi:rhodanese-related sulfurtransferase
VSNVKKALCGSFLLILTSCLIGVSINAMRSDPLSFTRAAAEGSILKTPVKTISLGELRESYKNVLVVDARSRLFFQRGRIPGAVNISHRSFARDFAVAEKLLRSTAGRNIVVYCSGDDCTDSEAVAKALTEAGLDRVFVFHEGWNGWLHAGLPEEKG